MTKKREKKMMNKAFRLLDNSVLNERLIEAEDLLLDVLSNWNNYATDRLKQYHINRQFILILLSLRKEQARRDNLKLKRNNKFYKEKITFCNEFRLLPKDISNCIQRELSADCGWDEGQFKRKRKGAERLTIGEAKEIKKQFARCGVTIWKGIKLK